MGKKRFLNQSGEIVVLPESIERKKKIVISAIEISTIREAFEPFKVAVTNLPDSSFKNRFTASIKNCEKAITLRESHSERRVLASAILNGSIPLSAVKACINKE